VRTIGVAPDELAERLERTLALVPTMGPEESPGEPWTGRLGEGYRHRLVWQFAFRRLRDERTYALHVDAHDGEVLLLEDANDYVSATVQGGVLPVTPGAEATRSCW
jgi:hypothetical protein